MGLARREDPPWLAIHRALDKGGWDTYYPQACFILCPAASDAAHGWPAAPTVALRVRLRRLWQLRLFAADGRMGTYPGSNNSTQLAIRPAATTVGVQGVLAWRYVWVGLGPSINFDRLVESAGATHQTARANHAGAALSAGMTFPQSQPWYFMAVVERRIAGSVDAPAMPVAGAPAIAAMRVPVSYTLLAIGMGWRR